MAATAHDSLRRAHQRRSETIALLLALDSDALAQLWQSGHPDVVLEVNSSLAEVHGLSKRCARLAGVQPVPLPPRVAGAPVSGNGAKPDPVAPPAPT